MDKPISLCELLGQVKTVIRDSIPQSWWVIAEISEIKVNYSGHCYLELIEKNEASESVKARVRATIWSSVFRMLQPYFETTTSMKLCSGIRVLLRANVEFHELYGFSLNITDIEPSYTLGELARQKQLIINRLITEGVYDMNRSLTMPEIPARIAVISSKTAAGFGDFINQLHGNAFGYKFQVKLFPAAMQGNDAEQSVIAALDKIYQYEDQFDVVVLIRGGGSQSDLNCFNGYWLNYNICQFPLPVLTGIGHEQDETIADLVSFKRLKTPTAVAEYLISCYQQAEDKINDRTSRIADLVMERVRLENERLIRITLMIKHAVKEKITEDSNALRMLGHRLNSSVNQLLTRESVVSKAKLVSLQNLTREYLRNQQHRLEMLEKKNTYLDPFLILKRGYSVTYFNGKALKDPSQVGTGDEIETKLAAGMVRSKTI